MSQCAETEHVCIIRGDTWEFVVSFDEGWVEVLEDPTDYLVKLVLRDDQNDALTPRLELTVTEFEVAIPVPTIPGLPRLFATFNATTGQTTALPSWNLVGYVELRSVDNSNVQRLFNLKATIKD